MSQVRITGWRRDASKIEADRLLVELGNLPPAEAHNAIETVLEGGTVVIPVKSGKDALELSQALRTMNFDARPG